MEFDSQHEQYLSYFHQLLFSGKLENGTPSEKASILRSVVLHLRSAHSLKILPADCPNGLLAQYEQLYADVADASGATTANSRWQSDLTLEKVKSWDFMKDFYKCAKREAEQQFPSHLRNRPIFKNASLEHKIFASNAGQETENIKNCAPPATVTSSAQPWNSVGLENPLQFPGSTIPPGLSQTSFGGQPGTFPWPQAGESGMAGGRDSAGCGIASSKSSQIPNASQPGSKWSRYTDGGQAGGPSGGPPSAGSAGGFSGHQSLFSNPGQTASRGPYNRFPCDPGHRLHSNQVPMCSAPVEDKGSLDMGDGRFASGPFRTAKEQLVINAARKFGHTQDLQPGQVSSSYRSFKKSLGTRRGGLSNRFVSPVMQRDDDSCGMAPSRSGRPPCSAPEEPEDDRLKGIEPKMVELIMSEIMDSGAQIDWNDIAGLEFAKKTMKEIVVWPMLRPDIFTGLRGPPKGLLLFGPPGTGKTLIGKCIASQSKSTFFSISASSLTSKWVGEGEKMVKALFAVARCRQPSVIFIDEIDSLLSQRSDGEHEASRRIKTEFLVQLDGACTDAEDRILVIGATNRPQEIDEAARRRFVKRLYIPLPETAARQQIIVNLLSTQSHGLSDAEILEISQRTDGYSGADMANLCREASLGPIRCLPFDSIESITADQVRPITFLDFQDALMQVRASVSESDLDAYVQWNKTYGSFGK